MSLGQGPSLMSCSENSVEVQSQICFLKIMRWLSYLLVQNPSQIRSQMHTPTADSGAPDPYRSIKYCHHIPVAY